MSIISVKDLTYVYGDKTSYTKALSNITFNVNKGDFLGIIGHTGSGKSTLIQMMNGLLKPQSGSVIVDGKDIFENKKERAKVRFKVGLVFQYPEYQLFGETVEKDIAFGPKNMEIDEQEIDVRVKDALFLVGLKEDILKKSPFELSGGQMRRVAIAGVMAMRPKVLILDEPTAGLDPQSKRNILDSVYNYHKSAGKTVIIISHDMEYIARYANRVLVLNKGEVFKDDKTQNIFKMSEQLKEIGLTVPKMCEILSILKNKGYNIETNAYTAEKTALIIKNYMDTKRTDYDK